ncbi:hypothetical protein [Agromyces humi]|uniref:hypothetical protein n=1 Tax=Agromyces humi TaxID=1766800 RepID=UPI001356B4EA|nr:hypothetical protein [Agromyces humi]
MDSGDSRDLPAYLLGRWPLQRRHALLTPAVRWRVFIEDQQQIDNDVILNTVLRIRQAGERDAARIADLLQLPEDLILYLLATADQQRLGAANSGQAVVALRSTVGWVYRDAVTGELWPEPGEQVEPLDIRFTGRFRARFEMGTAGRRTSIDSLLLDSRESGQLMPSATELARFSRSSDAHKRTAVISSGEHCLVVSPVSRDKSGLAVLTTQDAPQLSLGRLLNSAREQFESVASWANEVPFGAEEGKKSSLEVALDELAALLGRLGIGDFRTLASAHVVSVIELTLGRWVDDYRYRTGLDGTAGRLSEDVAQLVATIYGLSQDEVRRWASSPRSDCRRKVVELLVARGRSADPLIREVASATARYDSLASNDASARDLEKLAHAVLDLGRILTSEEWSADGQSTG